MEFIKSIDKTAIINDDISISYSQLIDKIHYFATLFKIENNDRVVIFSENRIEWILAFYSVWLNNGINVPLDFTLSTDELDYHIKHSNPKYIFTSKSGMEKLEQLKVHSAFSAKIINFDDIIINNLKSINKDFVIEQNPNDVACILYTSGTTGNPKGVILTFENLIFNINAVINTDMIDENDRLIALFPFHHIVPLQGHILVPFYLGSTMVFLNTLTPDALIHIFQKHKITLLNGVPRLYDLFHKAIMGKINSNLIAKTIFKIAGKIKSCEKRQKIFKKVHNHFGGHLKAFLCGGARLDPQISRDFWSLGFRMIEGYGMTEAAPLITYKTFADYKRGSVGKPVNGVNIKIIDNEVVVKGKNVMKGYYNNEKATKETIKDGWLYTGDTGFIDDDGFLILTGRKSEIIVLANGKNINPEEIEAKILSICDLIKEVAVFENNNTLSAIILPDFDKIKSQEIVNAVNAIKWQIIDDYNPKIASHKRIFALHFVTEELPKTRLGKIKRYKLTDLITNNYEEKESEEPVNIEYIILKKYLEKKSKKSINSNMHLQINIGLDSLDIIELIVFIENNFNIKVEEKEIANYMVLKDLNNFILNSPKNITETENINWEKVLNDTQEIKSKKNTSFFMRIAKPFFRLFFSTYIRLKINGIKNLPKPPFIIAPNHRSAIDGFLLIKALPSKVVNNTLFLGKEKHFSSTFKKFIASNGNVLIVNENSNVKETMIKISKFIKMKKNVIIFPEGAVTRNGDIQDFKQAFAIIAKELNVPIVPVGIKNSEKIFKLNGGFPKPGVIDIILGKPVLPKNKDYSEISLEVKSMVIDLLK